MQNVLAEAGRAVGIGGAGNAVQQRKTDVECAKYKTRSGSALHATQTEENKQTSETRQRAKKKPNEMENDWFGCMSERQQPTTNCA